MKQLKTIIREAKVNHQSDEFEFFADAQRSGEISFATYIRACAVGDGLTHDSACAALRENYQRAGVGHLCPLEASR